jgi:hypothetical protein
MIETDMFIYLDKESFTKQEKGEVIDVPNVEVNSSLSNVT